MEYLKTFLLYCVAGIALFIWVYFVFLAVAFLHQFGIIGMMIPAIIGISGLMVAIKYVAENIS